MPVAKKWPVQTLTPYFEVSYERGMGATPVQMGPQRQLKNSVNGKNPLTPPKPRNSLAHACGIARRPPGGPLSKVLGHSLLKKNFIYNRKNGGGAGPQTGGGSPSETWGICSAGVALHYRIETDGNGSKMTEISRVQSNFWRRLAAKRRGRAA